MWSNVPVCIVATYQAWYCVLLHPPCSPDLMLQECNGGVWGWEDYVVWSHARWLLRMLKQQ
jgi:hypothetical protein